MGRGSGTIATIGGSAIGAGGKAVRDAMGASGAGATLGLIGGLSARGVVGEDSSPCAGAVMGGWGISACMARVATSSISGSSCHVEVSNSGEDWPGITGDGAISSAKPFVS